MITLTNEQKAELYRHTRVDHVRGTVGGVAFDDSNVISLSYSNRCSNTDDVSFGLAYVGQISVQFCNMPITRKNWKAGTRITLEWGLDYFDDDEIVTAWFPVGVFFIASAEWTDTGVTILANDVISKFDKAFGGIQTNANTIGGFAEFACEQVGVEFALTSGQARLLPNGTVSFSLDEKNDVKTWRDFIAWVAQLAGGFVTATRDGKMIIKSFADSVVVDSWGTGVRIAGSVFSDYDTAYDGVSFTLVNENANVDLYGTQIPGSGVFIPLGANPFLQGNFAAAQNIATIANGIAWTPFSTSLLSNMVYDLGDLITCVNGVAGSSPLTTCIMSIDWEFKGLTKYKGFGADPSLTKGKTKTDKALNTLQSQTKSDKIEFVQYINSSDLTIEDNQIKIADVKFAVAVTADVEIWQEIKLTATNPSDLTLFYYLDDELIEVYNPSEEWNEGGGFDVWVENNALCFKARTSEATNVHTVNFHYHLKDVSTASYHHWTVYAVASTGTVTVETGDEHVLLWAQGMTGEENWGGFLSAADTVPFLLFKPLDLFGTLSDNATLTTSLPQTLITEDGDTITTEDGDALTTE